MSIHILLGMGTGGMEEWGRHGGGGIDVHWRIGRDGGHLILSSGLRTGRQEMENQLCCAEILRSGLDGLDEAEADAVGRRH